MGQKPNPTGWSLVKGVIYRDGRAVSEWRFTAKERRLVNAVVEQQCLRAVADALSIASEQGR